MAKRKSREVIPFQLFVKTGGLLLILYLAVQLLSQSGVGLVVVLVVIGIGTAVVLPGYLARKAVNQAVIDQTNAHVIALVRKRAQLLQPDAYGAIQTDKWFKEVSYFLDSQVAPKLRGQQVSILKSRAGDWYEVVDGIAKSAAENNPAFTEFAADMKPGEFEVFCAEELKRAGWNAYVTKVGRDQGVDVVADKGGYKLVLQCKLYSQPVGNKAVQEVVAARAYERAQFGAVVSNNRFTAAAKELADSNGVLLLHYSDLRDVESLLAPSGTQRDSVKSA